MTDLVYILAASHSGSTLLAMLLAAHPDVCTVGELKATHLGAVDRYRCSCGKWIGECSFWRNVGEEMTRRGEAFDIAQPGADYRTDSAYANRLLKPLQRGPLFERFRDTALGFSPRWRRSLPDLQRRNAVLADVVCGLSGAKVIVDSSKIGGRLKLLLRNTNLNVRVIRLIRDGRGVALAYMRPDRFADAVDENLRDGGGGGDRADERQPMVDAARQWRRSNEEAEQIFRRLAPQRKVQVRYETLCADPDVTVRRLLTFLGLDADRAVAARRFRSVSHHVVGNGMRLDTQSTVSLDERWRDVLDGEHLATFDSEAGSLNRRYGYV